MKSSFIPPTGLRNGLTMTLYTAMRASRRWQSRISDPEPVHHPQVFQGAEAVPIYGEVSLPANPGGTIVGTYGITGSLQDQWFLSILRRKAVARGYAIALFDWRAHGKTAELSPTLTSDGLYEGKDFVYIAAQAKALGCPPPFWFVGYSLGGQLALWGANAAETVTDWGATLDFTPADFAGAAVVCPALDSNRSLNYLVSTPVGRYIEKAIARQLKQLARQIGEYHPGTIDPNALKRVNSIWSFDHELVIQRLGFACVEDYYDATSPLQLLPHLKTPTLILYALDDPMFDPGVGSDLEIAAHQNPAIDLLLTQYGGHVGYISGSVGQRLANDPDCWWAWNRLLEWCDRQSLF